jgi:CubicO group peptidase (beta-lactamase class C family)
MFAKPFAGASLVMIVAGMFCLPGVVCAEGLEFYRLAAKYNVATNGFSMLVMIGDEVVFEQYDDEFSADDTYRLASGTKSFWGVAALCAQQDGLLDLDEKVAATITAWKDDPRKSKITVRHLLTFTSGLDPDNNALRGPLVENKFQHALGLKTKHAPGEAFEYGASHLFVFGELLQRKLKASGKDETPLDYLKRRVLNPIGLEVGRWSTDQTGNPAMPFGAFLTARQWAKFGKLILDEGAFKGTQIVPADKLKRCFVGTKAKPTYGLNWWLLGKQVNAVEQPESRRVPADTVAAMGAGKQRLYVIPSRNMVVVRQAEATKFDDGEFLGRLLYGKATLSDEPSSSGPQRRSAPAWFRRLDRNQDGKLTKDEVPARLHQRLVNADGDGDGAVTPAEIEKAAR